MDGSLVPLANSHRSLGIAGNTGEGNLQASLDRSVLMLNTTDAPEYLQRFSTWAVAARRS